MEEKKLELLNKKIREVKELIEEVEELKEQLQNRIIVTMPINDNSDGYLASLTGYDAGATQTLKNISGTLTWVTD